MIPLHAALRAAPLLLAAACATVGPNPYQRPEIALPATFVEGGGTPGGAVAARQWWADYRDPVLSALVARGLAQNLDTMAAIERIRAAEADLRGASILGSQLSGSAVGARERGEAAGGGVGYTSSGSLSADFVFDLFGGALRARQAAAADLTNAQADVETVRVAWLAELVGAYADARYYQQALALTRKTIATREETVRVTRNKRDLGSATDYELAQAEALLASARADLPGYEALFNAQVFRMATLLNEPAGPLLKEMQRGAAQLRVPSSGKAGVPADVLRNRPDVRQAELDLVSALATVGVATADMLPAVTLSGSLSETGGAKTWAFGPQISFPVFNQGALMATRERRVSEAKQAEIAWRAAIMQAVEDVQTAISNLRRYRQKAGALETAAGAYRTAFDMARTNYEAGALSLLDLLDADRSLATAELSAASSRNDAAKEWASLQIAIGAGAAVGTAP